MKAVFVKTFNSLKAADATAETLLSKVKMGEEIMVEFRRPRNIKHHRKLFALLNLVTQNTDRYNTADHLLDALKIATGHYERYPSADDKTVYIRAKSISFESMSQDEFEPLYERFLDIIVGQIIPGTGREDLEREVNEIIAGRFAA